MQCFMQNCHICIKSKPLKQKTQNWLCFLSVSEHYWCDVFMNYVDSLSLNIFINIIYWYVLVFVNHLTKMRYLIPITLMKIEKITECFYAHIWKHHDLSESFISDRNIQFISDIWQYLCQILKIDIKLFTVYYSEINEQIERVNVVIKYYFWIFVNYMQNDWIKWLLNAEFLVNNTLFSIILTSLFLINFKQNFCLGFKSSESLSVKLTAQIKIKLLNVEEFTKKIKKFIKYLQNEMLIV